MSSNLAIDLGRRLEGIRLQQNLTRGQLAKEAGVSLAALARLEHGEGTTLETFLRVMAQLGLEESVLAMVPASDISPVDRLKIKTRRRQRARPKKPEPLPTPWVWGTKEDDVP